MHEAEHRSFKENYEQSQQYVESLELQNTHLRDKIQRLNLIAKRYKEKQEPEESTLSYPNNRNLKEGNQLRNELSQKSKNVYGATNTQDQGCITDIFNVEKDIVEKEENPLLEPKIHKICQTDFGNTDQEVQVEIL